jgi:V-type H+-transporting ATPase subunit A
MLKCIITLYEESQKAIADSPADKRITWGYLKTTLAPLIQKVVDGKFLDPKLPAQQIKEHYDGVVREIEEGFQAVLDM